MATYIHLFTFFIKVCKAWEGHVTASCSTKRVVPLLKLLGADKVVSYSNDPENVCEEAFDDTSKFDLGLITLESEDSSLTEAFVKSYCKAVFKTSSQRRIASDGYGSFRKWMLSYYRSLFKSNYHSLDCRPLDYFSKLVQSGKLRKWDIYIGTIDSTKLLKARDSPFCFSEPVLDSAYAYEQAEEAFQATATTSTVGKIIITFGLRGQNVKSSAQSIKK